VRSVNRLRDLRQIGHWFEQVSAGTAANEAAGTPSVLRLVPPRALPERAPGVQQTKPWPAYDGWASHPGTGLKPERVVRIFRGAEAGFLTGQCDLFDDIVESDGHLRSLVEGRITAIAGKEWMIQPGGDSPADLDAATALREALGADDLDMVEFFEHQLEATFKGFSASEIDWQVRDGRVVPACFISVPHRRFGVTPEQELVLLNERSQFQVRPGTGALFFGLAGGEGLQAGKWVVSRRRGALLARSALLRTATWWSLFKRMSVRDWVIFAEKFGIPHVIGVYEENAGAEARAALETAVEDIGEGGQAVLSAATKIVIENTPQAGGDAQAVHPAIIELCNAEMSKLVNGATLNTETGGPGSFALGRVHQDRAFTLEGADARRLEAVFRRHVSLPFVRFNGMEGAKPPRLKIRVVHELDPDTLTKVASRLVNEMGALLDVSQLRDELGFRLPAKDEDAAKPLGAKLPADDGEGPDAP